MELRRVRALGRALTPRPRWQDTTIGFCQCGFVGALIPALLSNSKPPLATCLWTAGLLMLMAAAIGSLRLWLSLATILATAAMWLAIGAQVALAVEIGTASVDRADSTVLDAPGISNMVSSDGSRKNPLDMTFASRTLRRGTCALVTHGRRARVLRVGDYGPCGSAHCRSAAPARVRSRIADLRPRPAVELACAGLCRVRVEPVPCDGRPW